MSNLTEAGGIVGDIATLVEGKVPPFAEDLLAILGAAVPALFAQLAGVETDPAIALPYLKDLFVLAVDEVSNLATHQDSAKFKHDLDDAIGNLLENAKFGVSTADGVTVGKP